MDSKKIHQGRNIKRIREILGMKQETLAASLGVSQQAVSKMEERERVEEELLQQIAAILKVPVNAIETFDEDATVYNI